MCSFFSFVGDGHGNFRHHDWKDRQKIGLNADPGPDSHTHILTLIGVPTDKQDKWSKYEYQPLTKNFVVDVGVDGHDHEAARNWVEALDFRNVIPALRVKPIVHPFKITPPKTISQKHLQMLGDWASVWASVGASVWDSVGASVWDSVYASVWASVGDSVYASVWASVGDSVGASVWASVWAYISSFVDGEYQYDFSSAIKLWEIGLVPSYDGKVWRLHGGKDAKILWQGIPPKPRGVSCPMSCAVVKIISAPPRPRRPEREKNKRCMPRMPQANRSQDWSRPRCPGARRRYGPPL